VQRQIIPSINAAIEAFLLAWVVELKVRKFGNSLGVVLPKDVISRLNTKDGAPLYLIAAPEGGYRLTPYDPSFEEKMAKAEDIISRYRNTLNVLAQ
jgi:putative addiction module antidote